MKINSSLALLLSLCLCSQAFAGKSDEDQSFFTWDKLVLGALAAGGGAALFYRDEISARVRMYEIDQDIEEAQKELAEDAAKKASKKKSDKADSKDSNADSKDDGKGGKDSPKEQCPSRPSSSSNRCGCISDAMQNTADGSTVALVNGVIQVVKNYKKPFMARNMNTPESRASEAASIARSSREQVVEIYFELRWQDEARAQEQREHDARVQDQPGTFVSNESRQARVAQLIKSFRTRDAKLLKRVIEKQKIRGAKRYTQAEALKDAAGRKWDETSEEAKEAVKAVGKAVAEKALEAIKD